MVDHLLQNIVDRARGLPLYGLIDLASAPQAPEALGMKLDQGVCLLKDALVEDPTAVSPWLVPLSTEPRRSELRTSIELALRQPAVIWLASSLHLVELAERLVRRVDVQLTDREDMLLRYYDPRVLPEWIECLKPDQRDAFLSVAECWTLVDRSGGLQGFQSPTPPAEDPLRGPLKLNATQEAQLVEISEANRALTLVEETSAECLDGLPAALHYPLSRRCGDELTAIGCNTLGRRMALMPLVADGGNIERFFQSKRWLEVRGQLKDNAIDFESALTALST